MSYDNEIWKDIKGYEGLYQVSNLGRIRSFHEYKGTNYRIVSLGKGKIGYLTVCLHLKGKRKTFNVHRLVAETFIKKPIGKDFVNHKDENKQNNKVSNLEWCTRSYNYNYGTCKERAIKNHDYSKMKEKINYFELSHKAAIKRMRKVIQYDLNMRLIKKWNSIKECKENGFNPKDICLCCKNKRHSHKGYIWRYADEVQF